MEILREVLEYDATTGHFSWKTKASGRAKQGDMAGTYDSRGYRIITYRGKLYKAHRLAWFFHFGVWPGDEVDHINGIKDDNRIVNLRVVNRAGNQSNRRKVSNGNTSGYLGVTWDKGANKYRAMITVNGKQHYLGLYDDPEEAHQVYLKHKRKLHSTCTI